MAAFIIFTQPTGVLIVKYIIVILTIINRNGLISGKLPIPWRHGAF